PGDRGNASRERIIRTPARAVSTIRIAGVHRLAVTTGSENCYVVAGGGSRSNIHRCLAITVGVSLLVGRASDVWPAVVNNRNRKATTAIVIFGCGSNRSCAHREERAGSRRTGYRSALARAGR